MAARKPNTEQPSDLEPAQIAELLHRLVCLQVNDCIDMTAVGELEERIANELGRMPGISDAQMLAHARALIARALHEIADLRAIGCYVDERDPDRYVNAICREVDPGESPFG